MSSSDKPSQAPDVVEKAGYSDAGHGPVSDTQSFDKGTPLGAEREDEHVESHPAFDDEESITDTSSLPHLKRSDLRRSDGGAHAADRRPAEGPSILMLGSALVFFVLAMGAIGITAAKFQIRAGDPLPEDPAETVKGVEVRDGVGGAPSEK